MKNIKVFNIKKIPAKDRAELENISRLKKLLSNNHVKADEIEKSTDIPNSKIEYFDQTVSKNIDHMIETKKQAGDNNKPHIKNKRNRNNNSTPNNNIKLIVQAIKDEYVMTNYKYNLNNNPTVSILNYRSDDNFSNILNLIKKSVERWNTEPISKDIPHFTIGKIIPLYTNYTETEFISKNKFYIILENNNKIHCLTLSYYGKYSGDECLLQLTNIELDF
jgi:hypothetical protein